MPRLRTYLRLVNFFVSTYFVLLLLCIVIGISLFAVSQRIKAQQEKTQKKVSVISSLLSTAKPSPYLHYLLDDFSIEPEATPVPTPRSTPQYPPEGWHCVTVPILMYHHVQPLEEAKRLGHAQLTVDNLVFRKHLTYLQSKGYTTITLSDLARFFDSQTPLPTKPVVLTFDDGYDDFYTYALPLLVEFGMKGELFVPTGLMENPGYLSWNQIREIKTKGIAIGHHTWSHANMTKNDPTLFTREVDGASTQFTDQGLGPVTIFAYPYGHHNSQAIRELSARGFSVAVTTLSGNTQCKEDRLALHRTRIGNSALSAYGL